MCFYREEREQNARKSDGALIKISHVANVQQKVAHCNQKQSPESPEQENEVRKFQGPYAAFYHRPSGVKCKHVEGEVKEATMEEHAREYSIHLKPSIKHVGEGAKHSNGDGYHQTSQVNENAQNHHRFCDQGHARPPRTEISGEARGCSHI